MRTKNQLKILFIGLLFVMSKVVAIADDKEVATKAETAADNKEVVSKVEAKVDNKDVVNKSEAATDVKKADDKESAKKAKSLADNKIAANKEAANKEKEKIPFTDPAKPIIVKKAKPFFTVVLKSNPTTGYSWLVKNYDNHLIFPVRHKYFPPDPTKHTLIGAPGYEKWTFRLKNAAFVVPHATSVTLVYTRSWEDQGAQVMNFRVITGNTNDAN